MQFRKEMLHCYLVGGTQDVNHDPKRFLNDVSIAMASGITAFQYREKGTSQLNQKQRVQLGLKLRRLADQHHIPLIVDDDVELAQAINADGIHVGQKDQRIEQVLAAVGNTMFVGYSCNQPAQIEHANQLPVAYVGSGPIFPTGSKNDADPAMGLEKLHELVTISTHPIVAIGGLTEANMAQTLAAGVAGLSMISMILQSPDIQKTVQHINSLY
ncbi:thiamine phosphate synthase [Limosilactobacillus mucosae]|uniref:thiamine phosphate synthase n=1 Tax=Limosilactobacillus mucosae TaxID=97478 RepID=UPI0022DEFB73|nr:thiamine phosphate synthase [Limosilactobacillus mucosae]